MIVFLSINLFLILYHLKIINEPIITTAPRVLEILKSYIISSAQRYIEA